jgi:hypothetical protein
MHAAAPNPAPIVASQARTLQEQQAALNLLQVSQSGGNGVDQLVQTLIVSYPHVLTLLMGKV